MQLKIRVDQGEGPVDVTTNLFTIVAWERKYKRKASDMGNGIGIEDLAYLSTPGMPATQRRRTHCVR
jgi:hypothetical protein